eukprot:TRINITY_DN9328_c0_g1_i1.p1 TRINITY_DN9328_c0_g1~~TRINITY_DN9328_c0_g1_i1.p1  ORF type:complete len:246 (+),score=60.43 TRINITY_DN9328_c0_g1_i1:48-785(+)
MQKETSMTLFKLALGILVCAGLAFGESLKAAFIVEQCFDDSTSDNTNGNNLVCFSRGSVPLRLMSSKMVPSEKRADFHLSAQEVKLLKESISHKGYHYIRVSSQNDPEGRQILSAVPANLFDTIHAEEHLTFQTDDIGNLVSVKRNVVKKRDAPLSTNLDVTVLYSIQSPASESKYATVEEARVVEEQKVGAEPPQEQQSFFRKYWYIIVPAAFMMLAGPAPQEGQQQGGRPAQAGASAAAPRRK